MARRILGDRQHSVANITTHVGQSAREAESRVRKRGRSPDYLNVLAVLDTTSGHPLPAETMADIRTTIDREFALGHTAPIGLVGECFLGPPFEVHILDFGGSIVEHFEVTRPMPPNYERARTLACHPSYLFIEIHGDHMVAIRTDGSSVEVN